MKLKLCPFCGSKAEIFTPDETNDEWCIVCQNPDVGCNVILRYCHTEEEAITQWNRRTKEI